MDETIPAALLRKARAAQGESPQSRDLRGLEKLARSRRVDRALEPARRGGLLTREKQREALAEGNL